MSLNYVLSLWEGRATFTYICRAAESAKRSARRDATGIGTAPAAGLVSTNSLKTISIILNKVYTIFFFKE